MVSTQSEKFAEATTWRPDQGDHPVTIAGRVIRISVVEGAYGPYPLVEIEQDDGQIWAFHAFRDMAQQELANLQPEVGNQISIDYGGRSEKGYYRYRAQSLDGKQAKIDWSRFAAGASSEVRQVEQRESVPAVESDSSAPPADDDIPF